MFRSQRQARRILGSAVTQRLLVYWPGPFFLAPLAPPCSSQGAAVSHKTGNQSVPKSQQKPWFLCRMTRKNKLLSQLESKEQNLVKERYASWASLCTSTMPYRAISPIVHNRSCSCLWRLSSTTENLRASSNSSSGWSAKEYVAFKIYSLIIIVKGFKWL
jgi:hypothetical protein